ncbi:MAG: outer membrane beta-barrel protein [Bacteroidales bacterium]|jgi:hypothetical protein|nr:outer membrane beta-barrel protein [Bacteroidales bacterium]
MKKLSLILLAVVSLFAVKIQAQDTIYLPNTDGQINNAVQTTLLALLNENPDSLQSKTNGQKHIYIFRNIKVDVDSLQSAEGDLLKFANMLDSLQVIDKAMDSAFNKTNKMKLNNLTVKARRDYNPLDNSTLLETHLSNVNVGEDAELYLLQKKNVDTNSYKNKNKYNYMNLKSLTSDKKENSITLAAEEAATIIFDTLESISMGEGCGTHIYKGIDGNSLNVTMGSDSYLQIKGLTKLSSLDLYLSDGCSVDLDSVDIKKLTIHGTGTSHITMNGYVGELDNNKNDDITISGNFKIDSINTEEDATNDGVWKDKTSLNKYFKGKKSGYNHRDIVEVEPKVGVSRLGWSREVNSIDDLFSGPEGTYSVKMNHSMRWNLGFDVKINATSWLAIHTGLGYESDIFRFSNDVNCIKTNEVYRINEDKTVNNPKCKLVARYITMPLLLQFNVYKDFSIFGGVIGGLNFRTSHTGFKRDYKDDSGKRIEESLGTKYNNFKPVKLDLQFGIVFEDYTIYMKQSLTNMFKDNREIALYPYSFGVSVGF